MEILVFLGQNETIFILSQIQVAPQIQDILHQNFKNGVYLNSSVLIFIHIYVAFGVNAKLSPAFEVTLT